MDEDIDGEIPPEPNTTSNDSPQKRQKLDLTRSIPQHHPPFVDIVNSVLYRNIPSLHMLSNECLDQILSFCYVTEYFRFAFVCKRWYNLCLTRISLTKCLDSVSMSNRHRQGNYSDVHVIVQSMLSLNNGNLAHLRLNDDIVIDDTLCMTISKYCPNLETLVFSCTGRLGVPALLPQNLPKNLKNLGIFGNSDTVFNEKYLESLLTNATNLERLHLHLDGNQGIDGLSIVTYLNQNRMTSLSLRGCDALKPEVIEFIFQNYSDTLEQLDISSQFPKNYLSIKTNNSKTQTNLKRMYLSGVCQVTINIEGIGPRVYLNKLDLSSFNFEMPNLQVLDVSYNLNLEFCPLFLKVVTEMCPLIEVLDLTGCKLCERKLETLKNLKYLRELELNFDCNSPNFNYSYFARHVVPNLKALRHLGLQKTKVDDNDVYDIIANNHHINLLDICDPYSIIGTFVDKCSDIDRTTRIQVVVAGAEEGDAWSPFPECRGTLEDIYYLQIVGPVFLLLSEFHMGAIYPPDIWCHIFYGPDNILVSKYVSKFCASEWDQNEVY